MHSQEWLCYGKLTHDRTLSSDSICLRSNISAGHRMVIPWPKRLQATRRTHRRGAETAETAFVITQVLRALCVSVVELVVAWHVPLRTNEGNEALVEDAEDAVAPADALREKARKPHDERERVATMESEAAERLRQESFDVEGGDAVSRG